jgi:uncharacterized protein
MMDAAARLIGRMRELDGVAVAFSGGVDSALVLAAAARALPPDRVLAVIADSPSLPRSELAGARAVAAELGAELVEVRTSELDVAGYRANAGDRCYFCKHTVLTAVAAVAAQRGLPHVATGTHADDRRARHRPGLRAARELSVVEPLADAGLRKAEVRVLAATWSLSVADKPATPCLASRIAVGIPVSIGRLDLVERAESDLRRYLTAAGITLWDLRVRLLADGFRIELDENAHATVSGRPALVDRVLARLAALGLIGPAGLSVYRGPTAATASAGDNTLSQNLALSPAPVPAHSPSASRRP